MLTPLETLKLYPPHAGTLASLLQSRAAVAGARECLVFQGRSLRYAEVLKQVERTAGVLARQGVGAGDRVGVMSHNHPSSVFVLCALAWLGATMVPVNPDYGVEEARYVLEHAQVAGVVCSPHALPTVTAACQAWPVAPWLWLNTPAEGVDLPVLEALVAREDAPQPPPPSTEADATCVFIYTSGTTGFPKGVMHSQRSLVMAGEGFVARMFLQPDDRLLCVLPLFHVNAIFYSFGGALAAGATLLLEPRFSASRFWQVVHETGATEVNTIAAASAILMRRPRSEFVPGHRLRKIYGAPFDAETYGVYQQEFGVPTLIEGYGMSEVPGALNNPFPGPHKVGSMGRPSLHPDPALSLAELRIMGDDGGFLGPGEIGELVVRTPIVMQGYFRDEAQTRAAFRDGWFLTGDLAQMDADGYFWFVARKKDIIRKRGENISGAELDRVVGQHPAVLEAAAIPVPSELGEDDILVAVVLRPGQVAAPQDIAQWCRERLAAIKVPRYVAIVDALPHTPTHRVAKFKMREDGRLRARAVDLGA
ncbi:long-chain fatty acid--CoA ligase [Rhodoferax koreense]|uniref:Long-chain fatty acid--CoA ligase n=1 Tax=Rhodoferax koreensis TaxID=1842727 RepID=A0A1P8JYE5_9BURK|nr:AMP-binding protein [Rhodoferax koreense]APW38776.1 long-chain fatty acid--CoA ligase [Rhodoferax koreense]